ncbi:hypothetical protein NMY22_g1742 [Coprinellus aureogranulatus]|nr:hypothetical protein NMY22_g1742 [Coprinellus aureogranulatus]
MSNHSRPSPDHEENRHGRLHHSPSLPNIWQGTFVHCDRALLTFFRFPPHSRPVPRDIISSVDIKRSATPAPSPKMAPVTSSQGPVPSVDLNARQFFRSGRRNRKSRASYITPPLTPASSIKTTGSVDSSIDSQSTEDEKVSDLDKDSTRCLLVGQLNPSCDKKEVEVALLEALSTIPFQSSKSSPTTVSSCVKSVETDGLHTDGHLLVVFHDVRAARAAHRALPGLKDGPLLALLEAQTSSLSVHYMPVEEASTKLCGPSIVSDIDDSFYISAVSEQHPWETGKPVEVNALTLKNYLQSFGALQKFAFVREEVENKAPVKTFRVEFWDSRDAASAYQSLHQQTVFGMKITVYGRPVPPRASDTWILRALDNEPNESKPAEATTTIYSSRSHKFSVASQFTGAGTTPTCLPPTQAQPQVPPQWEGEIRTEQRVPVCANPDRNCDYCPSRKTPHPHPPYNFPPTPSPPVAICPPGMPHMMMSPPPLTVPAVPMEYTYAQQLYGYPPWAFDKAMPNIQPPLSNILPIPSPAIPYTPPMSFWAGDDPTRMHGILPFVGAGSADSAYPNGMPMAPLQFPPSPPATVARHLTPVHTTPSPPVESFGRLSLQNGIHVYPTADVAAKNQLAIPKIESGQDTRTTVMIKNIPNKMSDRDLIAYINKVCPRRIDFLYLRMDFQNGKWCNVGYAFVNFIETQDLLKFAKARLGEKWNMFSSEKVLQMSYANYQGKEALVEKFKNSCIMDERESWRPKIFYSFGPNQGLPEPFPAPTHMRRKERSLVNRGALYVPGLHTRNNLHSPGGNDYHRHPHMGSRVGRKGHRASANTV